MFDVAKHCGVSHQTVSRVINGHPNVSNKTRNNVLAAIAELGYHQNLAARDLATGRTRTIGVLSFDSTLYGPTAMLHSIQVSAREKGYRVTLNSVDDISNAAISAGIDGLAASHVDGILVNAPRECLTDSSLTYSTKLPVVFREVRDGEELPVVDIDQRAAGATATRHLISLGHTKIAHISGPANWLTAHRRRQGWLDALTEAGHPPAEVVEGDWTPKSGYQAASELLRNRGAAPITAIFAANDAMAFGAMKALAEAHVDVPKQVSVIGFDDVAESEFLNPALTTVRQDFDGVGALLLQLLLESIESGQLLSRVQSVEAQLVVRSSTQAV